MGDWGALTAGGGPLSPDQLRAAPPAALPLTGSVAVVTERGVWRHRSSWNAGYVPAPGCP